MFRNARNRVSESTIVNFKHAGNTQRRLATQVYV